MAVVKRLVVYIIPFSENRNFSDSSAESAIVGGVLLASRTLRNTGDVLAATRGS